VFSFNAELLPVDAFIYLACFSVHFWIFLDPALSRAPDLFDALFLPMKILSPFPLRRRCRFVFLSQFTGLPVSGFVSPF